jgi:hypothetical protein
MSGEGKVSFDDWMTTYHGNEHCLELHDQWRMKNAKNTLMHMPQWVFAKVLFQSGSNNVIFNVF